MRRILVGAGAAGAVLALLFGLFGLTTAGAAPDPRHASTVGRTSVLDWCPANASICQPNRGITTLQPGDRVQMECWIDARSDGVSPRWFYVTGARGKEGFLKAEAVTASSQWRSSPPCSSNKAIVSSLWTTALDRYNQVRVTDADWAAGRAIYSQFAPQHRWSGECATFVILAYRSAPNAPRIASANAIDIPRVNHWTLSKVGTPPRGTLVFWGGVGGYGHVAMSLGNDRMVGTQGLPGAAKPVTDGSISGYTATTNPNYMGWIKP